MLMGFVQIFAILGGLHEWVGLPRIICAIIAIPVAYIPILGTIVGIMGAIEYFGWSTTTAIIFFCWPYIFYIPAILFDTASSNINKMRGQ